MTRVLTTRDVQDVLQRLAAPWTYPIDTVDTIKSGAPDTQVSGVAVAWLPFTWALDEAQRLGCNLFITHEPIFYNHFDTDPTIFEFELAQRRRKTLKETGLVVLRCHDMWDRQLRDGITDQWAAQIGLENPVASTEFARCYDIAPTTAHRFATSIADATRELGQPGVQLIGSPSRQVRRVVVGTGAISPYLELVATFEPDLVVCSDDGLDYWRDGAFAVDGGPAIVVVHHGVTEEPGVARLATILRSHLSPVPVHHIPQRCMYEFVPPSDGNSKGYEEPPHTRKSDEGETE